MLLCPTECSLLYLAPLPSSANDIEARDVSLDPIPPGMVSTNVQDAIEELNATTFSPMESTVLGLAYGKQDAGNASSNYGLDCFPNGLASLSVFNKDITGQPQQAPQSFTLIIQNNSIDDGSTDLRSATLLINDSRYQGAILYGAVGVISRFEGTSIDLSGACVMGDMRNMNTSEARAAIILKSTFDDPEIVTFNTNNHGCVYIGNQREPLTVNEGDFVSSLYSRYYLRFLNSGTTLYTVFYDPGTGELTWNTTTPSTPTIKHPLVLGSSYGFTNIVTQSEVCGQGSIALHETAGVGTSFKNTVLGYSIFPGVIDTRPLLNNIFIGTSYDINALISAERNFIAANQLVCPDIQRLRYNVIIAPTQGAIVPGSTAVNLENLIAITSSTINLPTGPGGVNTNAIVVSNGPVTMGHRGNMVFNSSTGRVSFQQFNDNSVGGNIVFVASVFAMDYDIPDIRTGCIAFQTNDVNVMYPTADNQLVTNAQSFRMDLATQTLPANLITNYPKIIFNQITQEFTKILYNSAPAATPAQRFGAHAWAQTASVVEITPGVLSTASFTIPSSSVLSIDDIDRATITLSVRVRPPTNATDTKFYTAQTQSIDTVTRILTANVYETDTTTNTSKNATGTLTVCCTMHV